MPKFYLHIHEAGETIEDYEGTEFPDARSALAEAERAARDLLAEKVRTGGIIGGQRIDVVDDIHQPVGSVRFRTLLHLGDDG